MSRGKYDFTKMQVLIACLIFWLAIFCICKHGWHTVGEKDLARLERRVEQLEILSGQFEEK